jgi:hypothetical protein
MLETKGHLSLFFLSIKMAFTRPIYLTIAIGITAVFWILFNMLDELLFFDPVFVFYLPEDAAFSFILTNITAPLLGAIVAMNIYVFRNSKIKLSRASLFSGSSISVVSSACASCSSLGFFLVSTFGSAGLLASTIMSNYQIPLRLASVGILLWALYVVSNRLTKSCMIDFKASSNDTKTKP